MNFRDEHLKIGLDPKKIEHDVKVQTILLNDLT